MEVVRIEKKIESNTLNLPDLSKFIGRTAEIIILINDVPKNKKWPKDFFENFYGYIEDDKISVNRSMDYDKRDNMV